VWILAEVFGIEGDNGFALPADAAAKLVRIGVFQPTKEAIRGN